MCMACATKASLTGKYYDAFPADGVGDIKPINVTTTLLLTPDSIADDRCVRPSPLEGEGQPWSAAIKAG